MTTKKRSRWQVHLAKFLSGFNFVIFYILGRKKRKTNLLTCQPINCPADDYDDK